eukprot:TRINITY_DN262_c0_g1_i4.p1 TRINITY_DN262_c0_g1~~TRINITY_DN262_c0_g1_i4.p1  ORF type:complete len:189 (-),score=36.10 TRINITY_DN262_c0_g1_i4:171-704(-)
MSEIQKLYFSYNHIHKLIQTTSIKIKEEFKPDFIVAIGGGGFIPARIIRTFLRVPILAVSIEFYSDTSNKTLDQPKKKQWIDEPNLAKLKGKRVLVVDEVDDTRTTLGFCVEELKKNEIGAVGVFVIHNKQKTKRATLDSSVSYYSGSDIPDHWLEYPWESTDIDEHSRVAIATHGQ